MNRIAIISDIHSNIEALNAVLKDIDNNSIDIILCSGDILGYHTSPNEVIEKLKERDIIAIKGNHDVDILEKKFNNEKKLDIFRWSYDKLKKENRDWLNNLPLRYQEEIDGISIDMVHGSPDSIEEYMFQGGQNIKKYAIDSEADLLIAGHTHLPWKAYYGTTFFINSGSVGKPKVGKPVATYAILSIHRGVIGISSIKEIEYNFEKTAKSVEENGFIEYAKALRTGKA